MAQHEDLKLKKDAKQEAAREKIFQLNVDEAFKALLVTDKGRDFLWWLFEQTGINRNPFSQDPTVTGFNCGLLEVGQKVQERCIATHPEGYLEMLKERKDGRRTADAGSDNTSDDARPDAAEYDDYEPGTGDNA